MHPGERVTVRCADGKWRRAEIRSWPDTYYSQPASVKVNGKTVSGYVTGSSSPIAGPTDHDFIAYSYGKNGHLLPGYRF
jgi:hypothetical protein